jgi:hypothetical protein
MYWRLLECMEPRRRKKGVLWARRRKGMRTHRDGWFCIQLNFFKHKTGLLAHSTPDAVTLHFTAERFCSVETRTLCAARNTRDTVKTLRIKEIYSDTSANE